MFQPQQWFSLGKSDLFKWFEHSIFYFKINTASVYILLLKKHIEIQYEKHVPKC